jgi:ribosomal protein L29
MLSIKELRTKTEQELREELNAAKKALNAFVSDVLKGKEKNTKKAVFLKRQVARVSTVLNEKVFMREASN